MNRSGLPNRRTCLKEFGSLGAAAFLAGGTAREAVAMSEEVEPPQQATELRREIFAKVWNTPFIDTHEHLCDEVDRVVPTRRGDRPDDWTVVFSGYLASDLLTAGMPNEQHQRFYAPGVAPLEKWKLLEPYWSAVRNTGYGRAAQLSLQQLYGIEQLGPDTVERVQEGYEQVRQPGFYRRVLCDLSKIESCQVNWLDSPFLESTMPALMMQDLSIVGMFSGPNLKMFGEPAGIRVETLDQWHQVIDWWFDRYGKYAVAVKSQDAYRREIDYRPVPAENVADPFRRKLQSESIKAEDQKAIEDHLFWYAVKKATESNLPIKLHTGYYAGQNGMPLERLLHNAGSACELCRAAPDSRFVFMHICYPYYEELIAVVKHYTNAYADMCWSWIINPVAAKDFLKKYLVTAPANKLLTFGGDYRYVEQVVGHAAIARQGIALALSELVEEGWLARSDALDLVDDIMHRNARRIFNLAEKERVLATAPWL